MSRTAYLRDVLGFDQAQHVPGTRQWRVRCSSCASSVVNGTPIHERGCPNDTRECSGCNARVPANVKYCEDCQ
jgi:hypothetical protein